MKALGVKVKVFHAIFIGAPGVGKGTQCDKLAAQFGVEHLSSGNIIKQEMRDGTENGKKAKQYVDSGKLVPDEIVCQMILSKINAIPKEKGWILDGFPRTVEQGKWLHKQGILVNDVVEFAGDEAEIKTRLSNRVIDPQTKRTYNKITNPPPKDIASRCV